MNQIQPLRGQTANMFYFTNACGSLGSSLHGHTKYQEQTGTKPVVLPNLFD